MSFLNKSLPISFTLVFMLVAMLTLCDYHTTQKLTPGDSRILEDSQKPEEVKQDQANPAETKPEDKKDQSQLNVKPDDGKDKPKASKKPECLNLKFFSKEVTKEDKTAFADQKFCDEVDHSCCSDDNLLQLAKWWDGKNELDFTSFSRADVRKQKLEAIAYYTNYFLERHQKFTEWSRTLSINQKADQVCQDSAKDFLALKIDYQKSISQFFENSEKCWSFTSKFQSTVLCGVCDPKMQDAMNFDDGKVLLNKSSCIKVGANCFGIVRQNIYEIYPFLKKIEKQTRCSQKGENKFHSIDNFHAGKDVMKVPESAEKVDGTSCPYMMSFGSETNTNTEGDAKFLKELFIRSNGLVVKLDRRGNGPKPKEIKEEQKKAGGEETGKKSRRLNIDDVKDNIKDYQSDLNLTVFKSQFQFESKKSDEMFILAFVNKIKSFQNSGVKFDKVVQNLLQNQGNNGNSIKYPDNKTALSDMKAKVLGELDEYFDKFREILKIQSERQKVMHYLNNLTFESFRGEYKNTKNEFEWQKRLNRKIKNFPKKEDDKQTGILLRTLKDMQYPHNEDKVKAVVDKVKKIMKDIYSAKILFKKAELSQKNIKRWLTNLDYKQFEQDYKKGDWVQNVCKRMDDYAYSETKLAGLQKLCSGVFLRGRGFPSELKYEAEVQNTGQAMSKVYLDYAKQELEFEFEKKELRAYLDEIDYEVFKKRYSKDKFVDQLYKELENLATEDSLEDIPDVVKLNIKNCKYPESEKKFEELIDFVKKVKKSWMRLVLKQLRLKRAEELSNLFIDELTFQQFQEIYQQVEVKEELSNTFSEFVKPIRGEEADEVSNMIQDALKTGKYPNDESEFDDYVKPIKDKLKSYYENEIIEEKRTYQKRAIKKYWNHVKYKKFDVIYNTASDFKSKALKRMVDITFNAQLKTMNDNEFEQVLNGVEYPQNIKQMNILRKKIFKNLKSVYKVEDGKVNKRQRRLKIINLERKLGEKADKWAQEEPSFNSDKSNEDETKQDKEEDDDNKKNEQLADRRMGEDDDLPEAEDSIDGDSQRVLASQSYSSDDKPTGGNLVHEFFEKIKNASRMLNLTGFNRSSARISVNKPKVNLYRKVQAIGKKEENQKSHKVKKGKISKSKITNSKSKGHHLYDPGSNDSYRRMMEKIQKRGGRRLNNAGFEKNKGRLLNGGNRQLSDSDLSFVYSEDLKVDLSAKLTFGGFKRVDFTKDDIDKLDGGKLMRFTNRALRILLGGVVTIWMALVSF